ncbi:MAG: hypothetical protein R2827_08305 [Bdellovibrionales bacterium]
MSWSAKLSFFISIVSILFSNVSHGAEVIRVADKKVFVSVSIDERLPIGELFVINDLNGVEKGTIQIINSRGNSYEANLVSGEVSRGDFFNAKKLDDPDEFMSAATEKDRLDRINFLLNQKWRLLVKPLKLLTDGIDLTFERALTDKLSAGLFVDYQSFNAEQELLSVTFNLLTEFTSAGLVVNYAPAGALSNGYFTRGRIGQLMTRIKSSAGSGVIGESEAFTETYSIAAVHFGYQWLVGNIALTAYAGYVATTAADDLEDLTDFYEDAEPYAIGDFEYAIQVGYAF